MIIILGTPGAGKTTQTRLLAEYRHCKWFSMGELIRQHATGQARKDMLAGKIIDDQTTMQILEKALSAINVPADGCVFEGNPRSIPQARWWLKQVKDGKFQIRAVVHLVADPKIAAERMSQRGRLDDHDDNVVEERFAEYNRTITPILNYLKEHGVKVHEIDANGTIEEVSKRIHQDLGI
ncbi:MAG TPA: nucleoside monophosphate kinase [Candidatus Saccharimonadales bacterium]|nr:nucleoside monophosphate kinase [Candidatus Saccharimonadales bacterium]